MSKRGESLSLVAKRLLEEAVGQAKRQRSVVHSKLDDLLRLMSGQEIMWEFAREVYAEVYKDNHPMIKYKMRDQDVLQYVAEFLYLES